MHTHSTDICYKQRDVNTVKPRWVNVKVDSVQILPATACDTDQSQFILSASSFAFRSTCSYIWRPRPWQKPLQSFCKKTFEDDWHGSSTLKQTHMHARTHPFNGPFPRTTQVSRYQKGKTNLDFTEARGSEWQWHQLGHMQVCILLQTDNHASTSPLVFYRPDALPATQPTASKH